MDGGGERLQSQTGLHGESKFAYYVARMCRDNRRANNLVRALLNVNPREPFVSPVENRTIHLIKFVGVSFDLEAFLFRILLIHPGMCDFRLREGASRHNQGFDAGIAQAEGMWE